MQSKAPTVAAYLAELPEDRRAAIKAVREVILKNIDKGFAEGMGYGMMGYYVPHAIYPPGYHCNPAQPLPFAGLASQKQHMSLYMMSAYGDAGEEAWIRDQFRKAGKKLDMGKCCIRFKKLDDLPLEVIAEAFRRIKLKDYVARYVRVLEAMGKGTPAKQAWSGKSPAKKPARAGATPKAARASKASRARAGATGRASKTKAK